MSLSTLWIISLLAADPTTAPTRPPAASSRPPAASLPASSSASGLELGGVVLTLIDQVDIPAREPGMLTRLMVKEGDAVEEGQLLAQIDDTDAALAEARATTDVQLARELAENDVRVRFARKASDVAASELQRAVDSVAKFAKSVSQTELDRLKLISDRSLLDIEQAEQEQSQTRLQLALKQHDLSAAKLKRERRRVMAPISGVVVQWHQQRGEWVEPGVPVARMIRLDKLRAEGFGPAQILRAELVGAPVTLRVDQGGKPVNFQGRLVFVSPEVDPVNGQVRFWAEIDNPQRALRPGESGKLLVQGPPAMTTSAAETGRGRDSADLTKPR